MGHPKVGSPRHFEIGLKVPPFSGAIQQLFQGASRKLSWGIVTAILLGGQASCRQTESDHPPGDPKLSIVRPLRELGRIPLGVHSETVTLENRGTADLEIRRVVRTCSCLDVKLQKAVVRPGQSSALTISVRARRPEERSSSVLVVTNDPGSRETQIQVSWTAVGPLSVTPSHLDFATIPPDQMTSRTVTISRDKEAPDDIALAVRAVPAAMLQVERLEETLQHPGSAEIWRVTVRPGSMVGPGSGTITWTLRGEQTAGVTLPVRWTCRPPVAAEPSHLFLGAGRAGLLLEKVTVLSADEGETLEILQCKAEDEAFPLEAAIQRLDERRYEIRVSAKLPDRTGTYNVRLRVDCLKPRKISIDIPVVFVVGQSRPGG